MKVSITVRKIKKFTTLRIREAFFTLKGDQTELNMSFPNDFLIGVATAAYQVEGAWNADGKGESIWDRLCHTRPELISNGHTGDVACNSYYLYKDDIKTISNIGFQVYRFSISWTRIMPNGEITTLNQKGIDYYSNIINELLSHGIQPMVCIYHWDMPQKLQDIGGLANPLFVDYFLDYARILFRFYGDRVKWWVTFNEPFEIVQGYNSMNYAPALNLDSPSEYLVAHTILRSHGKVYKMYNKEFRNTQNGKVSISLSSLAFLPKTNSEEDKEATERAYIFSLDWFANPIYSQKGDYPQMMRKIIDENSKKEGRTRSRLPKFTEEEIDEIQGSSDFFSLNHYTTSLCSAGVRDGSNNFERDVNIIESSDSNWPSSGAIWLKVVPRGLRELLIRIKERYDNATVFITENGFCDFKENELNDVGRINYHKEYLMEILKAINEDGCNVIGYVAWSLLNNFEWRSGFRLGFGLIHVDFNDPRRKRTPKKSAEFFKQLISTRSIPTNY